MNKLDQMPLPGDTYVTFAWGTFPGDVYKGSITLNQRILEKMPKGKRTKLMNLINKAMKGRY